MRNYLEPSEKLQYPVHGEESSGRSSGLPRFRKDLHEEGKGARDAAARDRSTFWLDHAMFNQGVSYRPHLCLANIGGTDPTACLGSFT